MNLDVLCRDIQLTFKWYSRNSVFVYLYQVYIYDLVLYMKKLRYGCDKMNVRVYGVHWKV